MCNIEMKWLQIQIQQKVRQKCWFNLWQENRIHHLPLHLSSDRIMPDHSGA